ncbi:Alpha/Beta hydrolase protein [Xylariomycetidae sp. FL0641]|nr:Alpha/Beta hydrolase protein [Xylariomycetidae sp. FL0641]
MRDQRLAYQWVKDNIAAFGGDPDRITTFGLSSGGTFSSLHLMAFGGEQGVPFSRVWAMSGPPGTALNMTSDATEIHTRVVAGNLGCAEEATDGILLECLRGVPMEALTEAAMAYSVNNHPPAGLFTFIPSVDGDFFPDRQSVLYKTGKFAKGVPAVFGWTQDDGATNAGHPSTFQAEEDMKTPIKNFAHALTDDDYERLFALYPAADFEQDVRIYEARKQESDLEIPVHYFRAARIMRDLLFTCSSIDFGHEVSARSKALDPMFPGVWHYDLNQSTVTPMFHGAGMPWLGAVHGSDMDYFYNNMLSFEQLSEEDQHVSTTMLTSLLTFAYAGHPGDGNDRWPETFVDAPGLPAGEESRGEGLLGMNLQLIGGPYGTGTAHIGGVSKLVFSGSQMGDMQNPLDSGVQYAEMDSAESQQRSDLLQQEKLLERCAFISTLSEKLGI